jgi:hypothetical protein
VRCGFRDFSSKRTPGRRNAYLSSSTHLPGGDLWHPDAGDCFRSHEGIHQTEAELTVELGYVLLQLRMRWALTITTDDWLIILPTLLSIALIGPSHKRLYQDRTRNVCH